MNHPWDVCPMGQKKWGIKNSWDIHTIQVEPTRDVSSGDETSLHPVHTY
jgi:hypothetical protein